MIIIMIMKVFLGADVNESCGASSEQAIVQTACSFA